MIVAEELDVVMGSSSKFFKRTTIGSWALSLLGEVPLLNQILRHCGKAGATARHMLVTAAAASQMGLFAGQLPD